MFDWRAMFTYIVVASWSPGMNTTLSMAIANRGGLKAALPFNLGVFAGVGLIACLTGTAGNLLIDRLPQVAPLMRAFGACYLLYLAWRTLRSDNGDSMKRGTGGFLIGMAVQFVNPGTYVYAFTALTWVLPLGITPTVVLLYAGALALIGIAGTLSWALFGSAFKHLFARHGRIVSALLALLLAYSAFSLVRTLF